MIRIFLAVLIVLGALSTIEAQNLTTELSTSQILPIAARTTVVGTYGSSVIDRANYLEALGLLYSAASSAGTSTSLAVVLQESDPLALGTKNNRTGTAVAKILRANNKTVEYSFGFTQSGARQIAKVWVYAKRVGTIASSKIVTCRIETNNAGAPSGTLVHADASTTISATTMGTTFAFREFAFTRPIDVANSTVYHVVLTGSYDASGTNYIAIGAEYVASGGDYAVKDSAGWTAVNADTSVLAFTEQYNFAAISGAAFDTVTEAATSFQTKALNLRGNKRYLRAKATVAGSSASFQSGAAIILGHPRSR